MQLRTWKPSAEGPPPHASPRHFINSNPNSSLTANDRVCPRNARDHPTASGPHSAQEETEAQEGKGLVTVTLGEQQTTVSTLPASSSLTAHRTCPDRAHHTAGLSQKGHRRKPIKHQVAGERRDSAAPWGGAEAICL